MDWRTPDLPRFRMRLLQRSVALGFAQALSTVWSSQLRYVMLVAMLPVGLFEERSVVFFFFTFEF